jgi:4'-phosphopantetheinyl transferase
VGISISYEMIIRLRLDGDDVHVWLIPLPETGPLSPGLATCLSEEEAARAARFIFERDRARFIVAHAALREILAGYVGEEAGVIAVTVAEQGKPFLEAHPEVQFNLSHSGRYAMLAVARGREVGVDIERISDGRPARDIAERFFAPGEVEALLATAEELQTEAFFAIWSRKEAYIKARGEGLRIPLDSFEVSLGDAATLLKAEDREQWGMCSLAAPEGYAAALVVEGSGWRVRRLDWRGRREI